MPTDPHALALLADPHVAADRALVVGDVNLADHLAAAVAGVLALPQRPAGVVVNGDCAYKVGTPGAYAALADLLAPLAATGLPVHLTPGNHDDRAPMRPLPGGPDAAAPVPGRLVAVVPTPHADLYLLDTLDQPDSVPGRVGPEQLAWLAGELDARPDRPALVVGHHGLDFEPPPPQAPQPFGLLDTAELLGVLGPRRQVQAYVHGHTHAWGVFEHGPGLHVVSLPAVGFVFRADQPSGWVLVRLRPDGARLELHGVGRPHPAHGGAVDLKWLRR
jgi:3',5'-cyclic-AMP phosphodiesterase